MGFRLIKGTYCFYKLDKCLCMNWRGHDLPTTKIRQHDFTTCNFSHTTHTLADSLTSSDSCFQSFFLLFSESRKSCSCFEIPSRSNNYFVNGTTIQIIRLRLQTDGQRVFLVFTAWSPAGRYTGGLCRAFPLLAVCPIPHSIPPFIPLTGLFQIGTGSRRQGYLLLLLLSFAITIYRPSYCINMHMTDCRS